MGDSGWRTVPVAALIWRSRRGEVAERLKAPVLKTGRMKVLVGSNPTLSAIAAGIPDESVLRAATDQ